MNTKFGTGLCRFANTRHLGWGVSFTMGLSRVRPPPGATACKPTTQQDYSFTACLPWCSNNVATNCVRCKCQACPFCAPWLLIRPHPSLQPPALVPPPIIQPPTKLAIQGQLQLHTAFSPPSLTTIVRRRPPTALTTLPYPSSSPPPPLGSEGSDHGLCSALRPASLVVGDSVSSQFFRALSELLGARRSGKEGRFAIPEKCHGAGCSALRALPPYAQVALVCNRSVWLAYIRNDWLDVAPSYPVPDGHHMWHCAHEVEELSPELQIALRRTTYLCGPPTPRHIVCGQATSSTAATAPKRLCVAPNSTPTPACASTCSLATQNFSCGSAADVCRGCNAAWSISTLCRSVGDRSAFCALTDSLHHGGPRDESAHFHTAHCQPWSSQSMLRMFRVLILNAGAHRMPTDAYRSKMRHVGEVVRRQLSDNPDSVAVFRTTVPGFAGCEKTQTSPPHATLAAAEAHLAAHPFYEQHAFVPLFNRIATAEMQRAGGRVLDVYPTSVLRRDDRAGTMTYGGLTDCLHYRHPYLNTSLRTWARLLGEDLQRAKQRPTGGARGDHDGRER